MSTPAKVSCPSLTRLIVETGQTGRVTTLLFCRTRRQLTEAALCMQKRLMRDFKKLQARRAKQR